MPIRIALIYGTGEGQTEKIADYIAEKFDDEDTHVESYEGKKLPEDFDLSRYDGVIIGASVHGGRYQKYIKEFIINHLEVLQTKPSVFFSVSLTESEEREELRREVYDLVHKFLDDAGWKPVLIASFAGAVPFSQYGFIRRMIMRAIMRRRLDDVDTTRDYEYTDWASVDEFVKQFEATVSSWSAAQPGDRPQA